MNNKTIQTCRNYSIPLIAGVILALLWANLVPEEYHHFIHTPIFGEVINFHFLINDVFMVFFFAIAGVEIVNSLSPGGALNPIRKAVTPLMATLGGVAGPIIAFFILNEMFGKPEYNNGWGICTATDIALAWLLAKLVFGPKHPAVSFLLLLAVADDAIGLGIIAIFYPDPESPVEPIYLLLVVIAMFIAYMFGRNKIKSFWPYVAICGSISWLGMYSAHLHPALSLIFIVPFMPRTGIVVHHEDSHGLDDAVGDSTLRNFEHSVAPFVDFGLILFGLSNAGVEFTAMSELTWIILGAIVIGKTLGISLFTFVATLFRFKLPDGMEGKDVVIAGLIGGMGLTVALFVANAAYTDLLIQGAAKMGALFTAGVFVAALVIGKLIGIKKAK